MMKGASPAGQSAETRAVRNATNTVAVTTARRNEQQDQDPKRQAYGFRDQEYFKLQFTSRDTNSSDNATSHLRTNSMNQSSDRPNSHER